MTATRKQLVRARKRYNRWRRRATGYPRRLDWSRLTEPSRAALVRAMRAGWAWNLVWLDRNARAELRRMLSDYADFAAERINAAP